MKNDVYGEKRKGYIIGRLSWRGVCYEITEDYADKMNPLKLYKVESKSENLDGMPWYRDERKLVEEYADIGSILYKLIEEIKER